MRVLAALLLLVFGFAPAMAASDPLDIRLVEGGYSGTSGTILLGIDVRMPPGWHTYWKTPGEGGFPPEIDTSGSDNLSRLDVLWPAPSAVGTGKSAGTGAGAASGIRTSGYNDRVLLPLTVLPVDPSKPAEVRLSLRIYACKDYCAAFERRLEATVEPGEVNPGDQRLVAQWLTRVPRSSSDTISIGAPAPMSGGGFLVRVSSPRPLAAEALHVHTGDNRTYGVAAEGDGTGTVFTVSPQGAGFPPGGEVELVVVSGDQAVTAGFVLDPLPARISFPILVTALLGGLILNVMPCVFPVLALKLMALTAGSPGAARRGFAASATGIVASFLALGIALAAFKYAGTQIGWGIQFQNPWFLGIMAAVVFAFAAGTAGMFEIALPGRAATSLTRITDGHGTGASFAQGFVATLLATPCSAPFVGTAVGFALSAGTAQILVVFLAMGAGMALPYAAVAAVPGIARLIPRPGRWMSRIRPMLSLALFATAGWLTLSAFTSVSDVDPLLVAGAATAMGVAGSAAALLAGRRGPAVTVLVSALAFTAPAVAALGGGDREGIRWVAFDEGAIDGHLADGRSVIVNVTADWCLTCKVNDRTTWTDTETADLVNASAVAMRGDWTRPDPAIFDYLRRNGRFGIPFTIVHTPDNPAGQILGELLTPATVSRALGSTRP